MKENLVATRATTSESRAVEASTIEEYDKLPKALRTMKSDFVKQGQAKHGKSSELTEGNYVQKISNMPTLTTKNGKPHKQHCTRTTEETECVKTRLGKLIKEMKYVNKRNLSAEEFTRATKKTTTDEAAVTQKANEDRLQQIKRQVSKLVKVS